MLQRIQTLYLLLAACAFALCFMFPIAKYSASMAGGSRAAYSELNLFGKDNPNFFQEMNEGHAELTVPQKNMHFIATWPLITLCIATIALSLAAIALYHRRPLQAKITTLAFLLGLVYVFLVFIWAVDAYGTAYTSLVGAEAPEVKWSIATWAPVAGIALLYLAQNAIRHDERKVRAADRLR